MVEEIVEEKKTYDQVAEMRLKRPAYKETEPDLLKLIACMPNCGEFRLYMKKALFEDYKTADFFYAYERVCLKPYTVPCSYCREGTHSCFEKIQ